LGQVWRTVSNFVESAAQTHTVEVSVDGGSGFPSKKPGQMKRRTENGPGETAQRQPFAKCFREDNARSMDQFAMRLPCGTAFGRRGVSVRTSRPRAGLAQQKGSAFFRAKGVRCLAQQILPEPMQNKRHRRRCVDRCDPKWSWPLHGGWIVVAQKLNQRFIIKADGSAVVTSTHRMGDPIRFVPVEKMDTSRIGHDVVAPAPAFDKKPRSRKHQYLPGRFFFRSKRGVGRPTAPVRDRN
jgi:hypothetical protein